MKSTLFTYLILFISSTVRGQNNYIEYHKEIIAAERLLFASKVDSSLMLYKKTFKKYRKPFAKDCFVAAQVACMHRDTALSSEFLKNCFLSGVTLADISRSLYVSNLFIESPSYHKRIEQLFAVCRTEYISHLSPLRDSVAFLLQRDDRNKAGPGPNGTYGKYEQILDDNVQRLCSIVQKYGFPGEHLIGLKDPALDGCAMGDGLFQSHISTMFFHHHCAFFLMKPYLLQAIRDGELLPGEYGLIYEWAYNGYYQSIGHKRGSNNVYSFKTKCDHGEKDKDYNIFLNSWYYCHDTAFVNSCRSEIGMPTLQHDIAKSGFAERNDIIFHFGNFNLY